MFKDRNTCAALPLAAQPTPANRHERILIAEDDRDLRPVLVGFLQKHGHRVLEAEDGRRALDLVLNEQPALAILDIEMPALGGLEVIHRVREAGSSVPILVLSSRSEVSQRVEGLMIGADDYLAKPFDYDELLARVHALIRRHAPPATSRLLQLGEMFIDLDRMIVRHNGETTRLSRTECSILDLLAKHEGKPVTRERMLDVVWGYTYLPNTRTLDTHIWRIRKKLNDAGDEPRWIKAVPGIGYKLDPSSGSSTP